MSFLSEGMGRIGKIGGASGVRLTLTATLFLIPAIYVAMAWTPSSYSCALHLFGVSDDGLALGRPRPIRSDEWAVLTPYVQASVNNNFGRYNGTSLYKEDLRMIFSLPIRDWGMIFKPTLWGFLFLPTPNAYSLNFALQAVLFLYGYFRLFAMTGISPSLSALLSGGLFFTGFVQFWWTVLGPVMSFFPYVALAAPVKSASAPRLALFYWISVVWLLSFFYPPLIISLAFTGAVFIMVGRKYDFKPSALVLTGVAVVLASLTCVFYLRDYLLASLNTVYPGNRLSSGGDVPLAELASQFFPRYDFWGGFEPARENICEVGTVGLYFNLFVISFLDYRKIPAPVSPPDWSLMKTFGPLLAMIALMAAWMWLPIPSGVGAVFLWSRVPAARMEFAEGLLALAALALMAERLGLAVSYRRALFFSVACGLFWYSGKYARGAGTAGELLADLAVVPLVWMAVWGVRRFWGNDGRCLAVAGGAVSLVFGIFAFGGFNPLQSAHPIFKRERTAVTAKLAAMVDENPGGYLEVEGFPGAILNGWGYKSVSHVLVSPKPDYWRGLFPEMPEGDFNHIFNRYAHITVSSRETAPRLLAADALVIPMKKR